MNTIKPNCVKKCKIAQTLFTLASCLLPCHNDNFQRSPTYQELKRIEILLLEKIQSLRKSKDKQMQMGLVTPLQFYGMDTNPFAVELARVTLMIARKIAIDN